MDEQTRKKVGEFRGLRNTQCSPPKKRAVQPGDALELNCV
jgi:hypothetical protein